MSRLLRSFSRPIRSYSMNPNKVTESSVSPSMQTYDEPPICDQCDSSKFWIFAGHISVTPEYGSQLFHKCCCGNNKEIAFSNYVSFYLRSTGPTFCCNADMLDECKRNYDKFKRNISFTDRISVPCKYTKCRNKVLILKADGALTYRLYPYGSCSIEYVPSKSCGSVRNFCSDHKDNGNANFVSCDGAIVNNHSSYDINY